MEADAQLVEEVEVAFRKHPYAKCEDCPLYVEGKFVPSAGPEKAEIAFVGEAPGAQETREGVPFSGPSGKLLNIVMKHHGIDREQVLMTNACLCRPPDNATPPPAAVVACRARLVRELQERGVSTIVALGNTAAQATTGNSGVTALRVGPGRQADYNPEVRVIPTFHPAAALRQGDFFPHIVRDVGKVNLEAIRWTDPTITVADTEAEALDLLAQLDAAATHLTVDIEVGIEKDTSFDHPNNYEMLCVGLGYAKKKVLVLGGEACKFESVRELLKNVLLHKKLIMQNGKFDMAGLFPLIGKVPLWFDTMLASYTFDERPGVHGLKYQAVEYLGAPQYDAEIKGYVGTNGSYALIPRDKLYRYNGIDCSATWDLWEMYEEKYKDHPDLRRVHDMLVAAANELMYVEMNGIKIDREYLNYLTEHYLDSLEVIEDEINNIIAHRQYDPNPRKIVGINPRSPKQVKEYLFDQGISVDSTNEDTLKFILDRVEPDSEVAKFCNALLMHREEAKLYGTYVKGMRKRMYAGRVHPTFNLHGTTTGRLACRNPNLQNIPRGNTIRKMFVPSKPENVFVHVDYGQAELRVLTWLAQEEYFRDIFNGTDRDLFDELTPILYPGAVKPVEGFSAKEEFAAWKELRIRVKAYVYGLSYGREAGSIAKEFNLSIAEALGGMKKFFGVIPNIVQFREETRKKVLNGDDLITPWGRHRRFTLITKENKHSVMNEALAFLPQSTASDMTLTALTMLRPELKGVAYIRNIIHDALLIECHEDDAEEVSALTTKRMLESAAMVVGDYVQFKTDATIGKSWGDV